MILLREGNVYVTLITCLFADKLILKAGDEGV